MIAVIDYEMGNVGSILNMLRKLGVPAKLTSDRSDLQSAAGLILPGVGAFDEGVRNLERKGLRSVLDHCVLEHGVPVLGICLGMQLLTRGSEEGDLPGLGWLDAETKRFQFPESVGRMRIPHMGWNYLNIHTRSGDGLADRLFANGEQNPRFYFVHSYHAVCRNPQDVLATANYGYEFAASIGQGNIAGTQFHPEKSLRFGLALMRSFADHVAAAVSKR